MPINLSIEYPKLKGEYIKLRCQHDELEKENMILKNALKLLAQKSKETLTPTLQKKYDSLWKGIQK